MTALSRATAAGELGLYTRVCELPTGKDPDDLNGAELASVKAAARWVLECWCQTVEI